MEPLVCSPRLDCGGFDTAANKDLLEDAPPLRTCEEFLKDGAGDQRQADPSAGSEQVPEQVPEQGESPPPVESTYCDFDDYYDFMPMDDYYPFSPNQHLGYEPQQPGHYSDDSVCRNACEGVSQNPDHSAFSSKDFEKPEECLPIGTASSEFHYEKPRGCASMGTASTKSDSENPKEYLSKGTAAAESTFENPEEGLSISAFLTKFDFEKPKECVSDGTASDEFNFDRREVCLSKDGEEPKECLSTGTASAESNFGERLPAECVESESPKLEYAPFEELKVEPPSFESLLGEISVQQNVPLPVDRESVRNDSNDSVLSESSGTCVKDELVGDVLSDDDFLTAGEEDSSIPNGAPVEALSGDELAKIWELATKLCEARSTYNARTCRRKAQATRMNERKKAPARVQVRARPVTPDPMTNNGVCRIGKGADWDDPPEWDWGQPLPPEIGKVVAEILSSKSPADAPTITFSDKDCAIASSSSPKGFTGASVSRPFLKTKSSEPITLDSDDDELPDFSVELGLTKKVETVTCDVVDATCDVVDASCTVIAIEPSKESPAAKVGKKRTRIRSVRRKIVQCSEVITLESSDESDSEVELVATAKKQATGVSTRPEPHLTKQVSRENPQPEPATPENNGKNEWSCPICFETKDKVPSVMSTICGHIFCGPCLQSTVKINKQCPTCRKRLNPRQIHNLYM